MFGDDFVLATVILPEDLDKYIEIFQSRNLEYRLFLLKPDYRTAVQRCQSRTCHGSVTPEYWIKHFYEKLSFDDRVIVVDNTSLTPEETAAYVLGMSDHWSSGELAMTKKTFGPQTWQVGYNTLQITFDGGTWRRERTGSTY
jgi:hypothetical protein